MSDGTGISATRLALLGRSLWEQDGDVIRSEPIAVVGMACRFPGGASTPEQLWELLLAGADVVREVPPDRWDAEAWYDADPATPGRMNCRWGGFLEDVRGFDAAFFDISPREAERMDPQQRLALEVACEAVERAGVPLDRLRGAAAGVFFASYHNDYTLLQYSDPDTVTARTLTGTLHAVVANRISYALGLTGPSLAIDSACSSSLVATHLACQALRARDCDLALAGGVSAMLTPHVTVSLSKGGFMSPTGRCHTFDAAADGFVRAEGCGVVVLKRLSDAIAAGDPILAVIRGSAVNQDGESTTLSAPNGLAQAELVRQALRHAGLRAEQVSLIEAHGTGTELGDPIETDGLASVFNSRDPAAGPCWLGSLKSNVGHLEAAAGVGGLIKTVLCLQHGTIPPHALFHSLNRHIDLGGGPLRVATEPTPWQPTGSRIAGVSSFGVGGTNAHVLVEQPPALPTPAALDEPPYLLPLAARSEAALRELCAAHAARLRAGAAADGVCRAAARRRTHHRGWRVALVAPTAAALAQQLDEVASGARPVHAGADADRVCFVFTGQGSQWPGMGASLAAREPAFAAALAEADAAIRTAGGPAVLAEIEKSTGESRLEDTDVAQAAIFAVQYALVRLLAGQGVRPAAVIGHSIGELAAAVAAGMLTLDAAARAVVARGRLMQSTFDLGRMVSVRATEAAVQEFLARHGLPLSIAAVNGPTSIVVSGATAEVERAVRQLATDGIEHTALGVRFAFHSPLMADAAAELRSAAAGVQGNTTGTAFFSTVTGRPLSRLDADYLAENVRSPVRFAGAVACALEQGFTHFLEIGSHPALGRGVLELAQERGLAAEVGFCLHRERPDVLTLRTALGQLYTWGAAVAWDAVFPGPVPNVDLPTYPWQHRSYWLPEAPDLRRPGRGRAASVGFPGTRLRSPALAGPVFELSLQDRSFSALHDHRIGGEARLPATAIAELVRSAGESVGISAAEVRALGILRPVELDRDGAVQLVLSPRDDGYGVEVFVGFEERWERFATAELVSGTGRAAAIADAALTPVAVGDFYALLEAQGCDFGPGFRLLRSIEANPAQAAGEIDAAAAGTWRGALHPALLDAAAQLCVAVLQSGGSASGSDAFLPWSIDSYTLLRPATPARAVVRLVDRAADAATFDVWLLDAAGEAVASLLGWRLRRTSAIASPLRALRWEQEPVATAPAAVVPGRWLVSADDGALARGVADALAARGREIAFAVGSAEESAQALSAGHGWEGVLHIATALHAPPDVAAAETGRTLLPLVRTLAALSEPPRLLVVTRSLQVVGGARGAAVGSAAAWGLLRALRAEAPDAVCTLLDLDASHGVEPSAADVEAVVDEALTDGRAAEVAVRDGARWVARDALGAFEPLASASAAPCALVHRAAGTLDGFDVVASEPAAPEPGHIRVRVLAAGVNFRDVLTCLGSYPGARELGHECCGVVDALGEGVSGFAPGQRVVTFWQGSFASFVNVPAGFAVPVPDTLDPVAAATLPVAFGTAWYALHGIGRIQPGDAVLVHAGAGGVGMAAIQLAQAAGATVYATAGTPEKRALLSGLGVSGVFDSRSATFADDVLAATGGAGVALVLNSLIGDLITAGLRTLRAGGVFVELGKREVLSADAVTAVRSDVRYRAFDLGDEARADASLLPRIFADLLQLLEDGRIRPLPTAAYSLQEAAAAFRRMARAEHVGKIVFCPPPLAERALAGWSVITGGSGGVGQATARWLALRGARRIALWSRRAPAEQQLAELAALAPEGCVVRAQQVDVSVAAEVEAALQALRLDAPVTAVFHGAAVLEDATLSQQTAAHLDAVLGAKVRGAWHLHEATRRDPVELFVLHSAAGPLIDARGQANYAAANAVLDALAGSRRARGLPAVSVLWGPWAGVGMAARLTDAQRERWTRHGLDWWTADNVLPAFDALLRDAPPVALAVRIARRDRVSAPAGTVPARGGLRAALESAAPAARRGILLDHVTAALTGVLGLAAAPAPEAPLRDAGLDSLSAIELRNALTNSVGLSLPATLAFDHPTAVAITMFLLRELGLDETTNGPEPAAPATEDAIARQVEAMSDDEAEALLLAELGLGGGAEA